MTGHDELADLYDVAIVRRAEGCSHRGRLDRPTCSGTLRTPLCGDLVRLDLLVDAVGRISKARFDGRGCLVSQAGASLLCSVIEGRPVDEVRLMPAAQMLECLRVPLTPARQFCALLGYRCLRMLLEEHPANDH